MVNRLKHTVIGLAYCCLLVFGAVYTGSAAYGEGAVQRAAASGLLDGMVFSGFNGEKGQALNLDEDETITFQDGMFRSISCEPYGFSSARYTALRVGDEIHFKALTQSPSHGQIDWQGVISEGVARVNFVWTKQRWYWDIRREYWFKGALQDEALQK